MKFIDPRIDFAFKKIFGSEDATDILISFLESLLDLKREKRIRSIQILNPFMAPRILGLKSSVLDVRCTDHRGVEYVVEMQISRVREFLKRIQYNAAKAYVHQIAAAEEYPKLNQVIAVTITDFNLFDEFEHYVSCHEMQETLTGESFLRDILYYFIELPKFKRSIDQLDDPLDQWIYFIRYASSLEEIPAPLETPPIRHAFEKARVACMDREELEYYDKSSMAVQDARGMVEWAEEEGMRKGRREGRQEGRQETVSILLRQIQRRFGPPPEWVRAKLASADLEWLETWSDRIFDANSIDTIFQ